VWVQEAFEQVPGLGGGCRAHIPGVELALEGCGVVRVRLMGGAATSSNIGVFKLVTGLGEKMVLW